MSDRDLKDGLKAAGYSFEEMWFYRLNQEHLEELRQKIAQAPSEPARGRGHLRLIQGGRQETTPLPTDTPASASVKKAA